MCVSTGANGDLGGAGKVRIGIDCPDIVLRVGDGGRGKDRVGTDWLNVVRVGVDFGCVCKDCLYLEMSSTSQTV